MHLRGHCWQMWLCFWSSHCGFCERAAPSRVPVPRERLTGVSQASWKEHKARMLSWVESHRRKTLVTAMPTKKWSSPAPQKPLLCPLLVTATPPPPPNPLPRFWHLGLVFPVFKLYINTVIKRWLFLFFFFHSPVCLWDVRRLWLQIAVHFCGCRMFPSMNTLQCVRSAVDDLRGVSSLGLFPECSHSILGYGCWSTCVFLLIR